MGLLTISASTSERVASWFGPHQGRGRARLFVYPAEPSVACALAAAWNAELFAVVSDGAAADLLRQQTPSANVVCAALDDVRMTQGGMSAAVI